MLFVNWVEQNAKPCLLLPESHRDGSSVYLEETDTSGQMKIRVDYVATPFVVIDLDAEGQVRFFRKMGEESFDQRF